MKNYKIKDSGKRQKFTTGAHRDIQVGKGRFDLLPPDAILCLAIHMEKGCQKYGDRNWEKGIPLSRFLDSALRHINGFMAGKTDENHLVAAAWNLMCGLATRERCEVGSLPKELLDIPTKPIKGKKI